MNILLPNSINMKRPSSFLLHVDAIHDDDKITFIPCITTILPKFNFSLQQLFDFINTYCSLVNEIIYLVITIHSSFVNEIQMFARDTFSSFIRIVNIDKIMTSVIKDHPNYHFTCRKYDTTMRFNKITHVHIGSKNILDM
jgi:hypothetical protein